MKSMKTLLIAMFAIFSMSSLASAAGMTLCTGAPNGNYSYVGEKFVQQMRGTVDVTLVPTAGAWENLQKLKSGECDAAITQSDTLYVYNKDVGSLGYYSVSEMYTEYAHLLCNRNSAVKEWGDLADKTVKIYGGGKGSGSEVTARGLKQADAEFGGDDYKDLAILNSDPKASLVQVKARSADCMFYVGSKGNPLMTATAEKLAADLTLVPIVDKDFNDVEMKDANGNEISVWTPVTMPSDTYGKIMPAGTLYGNKSLDTIGVTALFIVGQNWADSNPDIFTDVGLNIGDVVNTVRADKGVELVK